MTTEQTAASVWSLFGSDGSRASGPPVFGRPEERDEAQRFAAVLQRAETAEKPASQPDAALAQAETAPLQQVAMMTGKAEDRDPHQAPTQVDGSQFFGEDGLTFGDVVDIINPLQHLPVVSTLYRELTGDEISDGARLAGGALYGGPVGFVGALANTISEDVTGKDVGGAVLAALSGEDAVSDGAALAQVSPASGPTAALQTASLPSAAAQPVPTAAAIAPAAAVPRTEASPIMAAQPVAAPFAAIPQGSPILINTPAGAPRAPQTQASQTQGLPQPPVAAAPSMPTLSPDAANALMRLAQQTEAPPVAPAPPPQISTAPTPPPRPTASAQPSTASATAAAAPSPVQTASLIESPPLQDLPEAMLQALNKYESMKR